jgi:hypothetical protein
MTEIGEETTRTQMKAKDRLFWFSKGNDCSLIISHSKRLLFACQSPFHGAKGKPDSKITLTVND